MRTPILATILAVAAMLASCTQMQVGAHLLKKQAATQSCLPEGHNKVGNPYIVDGIRYTPINSSYSYNEKGIASWYGSDFHGKPTANGECYNMYAFTAAHKTLPLPTVARVTNLENGKSIVVKINDRGPFVRGRVIDLSYAAAQSLGMVGAGTAPVEVVALSGPHHRPGGASFTRTARADPAQPATLPSFVPSAVEEETLDDTPIASQAPRGKVAASPLLAEERLHPASELAMAEARLSNPPPPRTTLPTPPEASKVPHRNFKKLEHTRAFVQVGAFGNAGSALTQRDRLAAIHASAFAEPIVRNGKTLQRVRIGPFSTTGEAEEYFNQALDNGFPAATIVIEGE